MQDFTFEEFQKGMSNVHIQIDGVNAHLRGNNIFLAISLINALEEVLESSNEKQKLVIKGLITQVFAEGFVDEEV